MKTDILSWTCMMTIAHEGIHIVLEMYEDYCP